MVKTGQNIIHNSSFNFEYGNKASASRCNILIESIFDSHILPELDKAILNSIPEGISIELSKLEINIGTIDENELSTNLAGRIRASLENALRNAIRIKQPGINGNGSVLEQSSYQFLNQFIENFLLKGYFQFGLEESITIDDLVSKTIRQNKAAFVELIRKYTHNDSVIKRIAYSFSFKSFDLILSTLFPIDSGWILNYREILVRLKKNMGLTQLSDNEFFRRINSNILKYLLNETSLTFNKIKFSESILKEFIVLFNPDSELLTKSIQEFGGINRPTAVLMAETLAKLPEERNKYQAEDENERINFDYVLAILNSGDIDLMTIKHQLLKAEIIEAINDKQKRELLIKRLESNGVISILKLFYHSDVHALHKLIKSFASYFENLKNGDGVVEKASTINEFVLHTILYVNESVIREFDKEEFVLFLIYAGGLDISKTVKSTAFQKQIESKESIDIKKMYSLIEDEQQYHEISDIQKLLFSSETDADAAEELKQTASNKKDFSIIYKRKIVRYYLDFGRLPDAFVDLNWKEVQSLFIDLIHQKDDFLVESFKKNQESNALFNRINLLIGGTLSDDLDAYLSHFFPKENSILTTILTKIEQHFAIDFNGPIRSNEFRTELFIRALALSKGGSLPGIFMISAIEFLDVELQKDSIDTTTLFRLLFSKSEEIQETGLQKILYDFYEESSSELYKKTIEKEFETLLNKLQVNVFDPQYIASDVRSQIRKIAFYSRVDQKGFLALIQKKSADLLQLYALFKFYLPQNQWQLIEKLLLSNLKLKEELELIQQHSDLVLSEISHPELDLGRIFKNTNQPEELKTLFTLIMSDEELFEKFISSSGDSLIPQKLVAKSGKTEFVLNQLLLIFSELSVPNQFDKKFGKSLVFSFAILIFLENKTFSTITFAKAFLNHLLRKLSEINKAEIFYFILDKLRSSNSKELKEIVEIWAVSEKLEEGESKLIPDSENKISSLNEEEFNSSREINYYFSVLQFYANHGFFPWWANNISFTEFVIGFKKSSELYPLIFDETFLRLEKENQVFERLIGTIPNTLFDEFERIISSHSTLQTTWKKILRKAHLKDAVSNKEYEAERTPEISQNREVNIEQLVKSDWKDPELFFKELNYLKDEGTFTTWLNENVLSSSKEVNYYFAILQFYANNGSFPWWANNISFSEFVIGFKKSSELYPLIFDETFLRLEKENQVFERLIGTIPNTLFDEFDQIISSHPALQTIWKEILQKKNLTESAVNKEYKERFTGESYTKKEFSIEQLIKSDYKDKDSLFRSLYYLSDEEILKTWLNENTEIADQINEYLLLSPYFYFRNVNPAQWRKMVYEFSFDYYKADTPILNSQFHTGFLNYLNRNYTSINWIEILGKVYRVIHSEETSGRVSFPEPLIKLLNLELIKTQKRNQVMGDTESFLTDETDGNVVIVDNAGLILFWPFLIRLFENLSFVKNGNFINSESRNRAVYLLQQLVYNEINFPEYKLVLNKLLVGMPAEEHLIPIDALNDEELEIAKSLLFGLINNWDKVANSTPEGIQETFLKREGILKFERDKVVLSVEKKGVDVLMNSIPWSISLIKLAWMQKPLHVEWI